MKKIIFSITMILVAFTATAQEKCKASFPLGADIVSSYVWRGAYSAGASIQPYMGLEVGGFSLGAWGSVDFVGEGSKEVDFTAAYSIGDFSVAVTDYWWAGEGADRYFMYGAHKTDHFFEGALSYTLPFEKFPLSFSWSTMFAGGDYFKDAGEKRSYSTYIEASYPFAVKDVELAFSVAMTPWEGLYAEDISVVSIALSAARELRITDSFSLPIFGQLIANPRSEDIYFVFGVSF